MGERDLIASLCKGSATAWRDLMDLYLRLVHHVVRATLAGYGALTTESDVEDIVYELWAGLVKDDYKALAAIGPPYDLKAYLAVSARRKAIDFVRGRRRTASIDRAVGVEGEETFAQRIVDDREPAPAGAAPEQVRALQQAMSKLGTREQMIVRLFYIEGMKYRQIAAATGISMNSIGPTLQRAVEKLRSEVKL